MRVPWPLLMPAGSALLRVIPRTVALSIARRVGDVCDVILRSRRAVIESNLVRTAPHASARERRRLARMTFRRFAMVWVDVLRMPAMSREEIVGLIDARAHVEARALFDQALSEGRGLVIVAPHLGGMELSGAYLAASGLTVTSVAEDTPVPEFEALQRYRSSAGVRLLPQRRAAVAAFRALERGEVVAVVADRLILGGSATVDFCGGRRLMPTGPAALALKAGAPIIVACMACEENGDRYTGLCQRVPLEGRDAVDVTRAIAAVFSEIIARHPDQWFVFQPQWLPAEESELISTAAAEPVAVRVP